MARELGEFGKISSKLRTDRGGLSQTEASRKAGVSQSTISGWEKGTVHPEFENLAEYSRSLDLRWPESRDFFAAALRTFSGKLGIKIRNGGIIPENLMIDLLSIFLGADGKSDKDSQVDAAIQCVDRIKASLNDRKMTFTGDFQVTPRNSASWSFPLPPPSAKNSGDSDT